MNDALESALLAQASAVLILLAGGLLVYRTFRERYLLAWLLGWFVYLGHKVAFVISVNTLHNRPWLAFSDAAFVVATLLFIAAVVFYTNAPRRLLPYGILALITMDLAVARALWWPDSLWLAIAVFSLHVVMRAAAVIQLALFSRGRKSLGPWLLVAALILFHVDTSPLGDVHSLTGLDFPGLDIVIEILLGLSMVVIVLDEAQTRTRRLKVVNALTATIVQSKESEPMLTAALEELRSVTGAKSAWARLMDSDTELALVAQVGLPESYVRERPTVSLVDSFSAKVMQEGLPGVIRASKADDTTRERLLRYGFEHVVIVPLRGKATTIGVLALASDAHRNYTADELRFLAATGNQLGMAVENTRLFEQILRSQKQWISTFDSMGDAILVHDENFQVMKVNRALLRRLGRELKDVIGRPCKEVLPSVGTAWQDCPYCAGRAEEFGDAPDPCFGGYSLTSTSSYAEADGQRTGTVHIVKDTSEHRAAEEKYRMLFEQVQEGVFISTPEGRLIDCNHAFVRLLGYGNREELLGVGDIANQLYVSPESRDTFRQAIAKDGFVHNYEVLLRRRDGSTVTALETSFATRDSAGRIERYQGFLLDISKKKKAEEELRRRNRELIALNTIAVAATQSFQLDEILGITLDQVAELMAADTAAIFLYDEPSGVLRRRAGYGLESELARTVTEMPAPAEFLEQVRREHIEVVTQEHIALLPAPIGQFIAAEGLRSFIWVVLWSSDKVVGVLGVSARSEAKFSHMDEQLVVAIARQLANTIEKTRLYDEIRKAYDDLTRAQEQLLQSEKMSAVGQLIAGVAHELNNPLTAILGYVQLVQTEDINDRVRDFVNKLEKQAHRTHKVVQNLLSFARQRKPARQPVDLRRVVEETLALRDYDLKLNNISLVRDIAARMPDVVADEHQLEQVFLNIINNSVDAMLEKQRGGTLQVRVFTEGSRACVEFHDSGPGMRDPKRIFDPFYTTKPVGKGTGLGLSICYGIIKEHGGEIIARNHPAGGAEFQIWLPGAGEVVEQDMASVAPDGTEAPLSGRVLVVDDEEAVLEFEREALRNAGAQVFTATTGEEAVARLQKERFDAVVLDGKMPGGWTAMGIHRWVAENRPGLEKNILFALSNVGDPETRAFIEEKSVLCIVKPFEVADLVSMTRRAMERSRALVASSRK